MKKILVLCHPKEYSRDNHFLSEWFDDIQKKLLNWTENQIINSKYETVDILQGGTYVDDSFSSKFVNKHKNKYNLIFIPDCGGQWFYIQEWYGSKIISLEDAVSNLLDIIVLISEMLTDDGWVIASKFLYPDLFYKLVSQLEQNGFVLSYKADMIGNYLGFKPRNF